MPQYNTHRNNPFHRVFIVLGVFAVTLLFAFFANEGKTSPPGEDKMVADEGLAAEIGGTSWSAVIGGEDGWDKRTDLVFTDNRRFHEVNYVYYDSDMNAGYSLISVIEGTYTLTGNRLRRTGTMAVYNRTTGGRSLLPYNRELFIEMGTAGGLRIFSDGGKGLIYEAAQPRGDWRECLGFNQENAWGAVYAAFFKAQNFKMKEYLFYNDRMFFPTHSLESEFPALLQASFYQIPEFAEPVMVLVEFLELKSRPEALDTFPIEIAYIIKDGAVTRNMTEAESAAIFGEIPESGMRPVKGKLLQIFVLAKPENSKAALNELYDWLEDDVNR